jgi:hypothetical protein
MRSITNISPLPPTTPAAQSQSDAPPDTAATNGGAWSYAAQGTSQFPGTITCNPIIEDPADWRKHNDVSQLDYAEELAQDAFRNLSSNDPTKRLGAQNELNQAEQIRKQVEPDLTPSQQQTLEQINSEEKQAFADRAASGNSFANLRGIFAPAKMIDAAAKSKTLDNSILGLPTPSPIPIWNIPFGK